jgi:hypothetical protein
MIYMNGHVMKSNYYNNDNNNMNGLNSHVGTVMDCPQNNANELVNCWCQYPGEDLFNDNQRRIPLEEAVAIMVCRLSKAVC